MAQNASVPEPGNETRPGKGSSGDGATASSSPDGATGPGPPKSNGDAVSPDATESADRRRRLFEDLMRWANGGRCRHDGLLAYFGEQPARWGCGRCDVCVRRQAWKRPFLTLARLRRKYTTLADPDQREVAVLSEAESDPS
ncbi:MAG: RecQ family zinc-binding domain-containing protein [Candidatus Eisenbacteria bacterium]|uniref:RecQ family zinc-binding domain-containing protein n=1 Tax=Eiseniibacteriota bacterium TaxID=2212470 RepID=A0A956RMI6_UNCEI|nr:RecQ family zinc-binding domain-containing protein [Candidatus Eisenbacteria bacterium]